jgi:elongation factor P
MYSINDLKTGVTIELDNQSYVVLEYQHSKLGRGGAIMRTKLKNLTSGNVIDRTFRGKDMIKPAMLSKTTAQYLYKNKENYYFMDSKSFEQFSLSSDQLGKVVYFLKEGMILNIQNHKGKPCNINLPFKIDLKVVKTEPGVKGDRVEGGTKPAELETGLVSQVPLFVKEGDIIKVDTRDGSYVERVK